MADGNASHNDTNFTVTFSDQVVFANGIYHAFVTLFVIILIGIIFGNSLVLATNYFNRNLFKQGGCYLVCLAVADLLIGLLLIGRLYMFLFGQRTLCIPLIWLEIFCESASVSTLVVISIDRYYKITYPLRYRAKVTTRKCVYVVAVVWLYSGVFAMFGVLPYHGEMKTHWSAINGCSNPEPVYYLVDFVISFAIPCFILMFAYVLIFVAAYRRRRAWAAHDAAGHMYEQHMLSKDLRNARILAIVVLAFMICWGPYFFQLLVSSGYFSDLFKDCVVGEHPYFCLVIHVFLPMAHSCCNPIIYALSSREYRTSFKNIFKNVIQRQRTSSS